MDDEIERGELVARMAVEHGFVDPERMEEVLGAWRRAPEGRFEQQLLRQRLIDSDALIEILSEIRWRRSDSAILRRYEIASRISSGAAGVVYRAVDRESGEDCALKVIPIGHGVDLKRFEREQQALTRLDHPNVVRIRDAGVDGARMFLAMELVEGGTFRDVLADPAESLERRVALVARIARGIEHVHRSGIVHRDLKPENILLDSGGEPRIADFGLVRLEDSETLLTSEGVHLGTPGYMAPEQVVGKWDEITPSVDIYALGGMLYEILAGRPPHEGNNAAEVFTNILDTDPTRPRDLAPDVSPFLERVALRALAKERGRRHATAAELAEDLESWLAGDADDVDITARIRRTGRVVRRRFGRGVRGALHGLTSIFTSRRDER